MFNKTFIFTLILLGLLSLSAQPAMHFNSYDTEDPIFLGKETVYVIAARNEGTSPCTNIKLENYISKKMKFVSASGPSKYTYKSGKLTFAPVPTLLPGKVLRYKVKVSALKAGFSKNIAIFQYDQFSKKLFVEESTTIYGGTLPSIHINDYDTEDPVKVGKATTYVIEVRNEGHVLCKNVQLENIIPENAKFVKAVGPVPYKVIGKKIVFQATKKLAPGKKLQFFIQVKFLKAGSAKNIAILKCSQFKKTVRTEEGTSVYR